MAVVMTQRSMGTKKTRDLRYFFATKYSDKDHHSHSDEKLMEESRSRPS